MAILKKMIDNLSKLEGYQKKVPLKSSSQKHAKKLVIEEEK